MYDLNLTTEASCSRLYQWYIGRKAHPIDMAPSIEVVERIEDDAELFEPVDVELSFFDVRMVGFYLDIRIEPPCCLLCDCGLRLLDVFMSEEELPVQIAEVDCIEINDMYFPKASKDKVLEELAADTTCADKQNTGLKG